MTKELRQIPRNPEKFEAIDLLDAFLNKKSLKLSDKSITQSFVQSLSDEINQNKTNPIMLHGRRIESMFGYVAASLGKCAAIKQEDKGDLYSTDIRMQSPDYRVILDNGHEFFVEVKNHRPKDPKAPYHISKSNLEKLLKYSEVFQRDLKIAIYWSQWNIWTLLLGQDLITKGSPSIDLLRAVKINEMAILGDQMIATTPPLIWRLRPDPNKPILLEQARIDFTIGSVEIYCGDTLVEDSNEQNMAFYFMLFGRWLTNDPQPQVRDGVLESVDIVAVPETSTPGQPFQFLGDLSGMISRYYDFLTTSEHGIERLRPTREPSTLGVFIPDKSRYLKLWRFTIKSKRYFPKSD